MLKSVGVEIDMVVSDSLKIVDNGCTVTRELMEVPDYGVSNAIFMDQFGYGWMLQQIYKLVSYEERMQI